MAKKPRANSEQRDVTLPRQGKPKPRSRGYDWGDGKGPVHSRPEKIRGPSAPATPVVDPLAYTKGPLPYPAIQAAAQAAGAQRYGGVEAAQALQGQQIPAWYDAYKASVLTPQQVAAQYAPSIQASEATAAQSGQGVLKDVDPNSPAAQQDALAAKAREALVNLGTGVLRVGQQADTTYYQGRQGVADAARIGAQSDLASRQQATAADKGAFVQDQVTQGVQNERQYGLGLQHQNVENAAFGLKTQQEVNDAAQARARIREQRAGRRARQRDKNQDQSLAGQKFRSQEAKDAYQKAHGLGPYKPAAARGSSGLTPVQQRTRRKEQRKAVGRIEDNIIPRWEQLKGQKGTVKLPDGSTQTRLPTPSEIKDRLRSEGYSPAEVHLALMIRAKKPLTAADIRAAKRLGIYKIPKSWLGPKRPKATVNRPTNAPATGGYRPT